LNIEQINGTIVEVLSVKQGKDYFVEKSQQLLQISYWTGKKAIWRDEGFNLFQENPMKLKG